MKFKNIVPKYYKGWLKSLNCWKQYKNNFNHSVFNDSEYKLANVFCWARTSEGLEYWSSINQKINEYLYLIDEVGKINKEAADYMLHKAYKLKFFELSDDLSVCFEWGVTPQGSDFWVEIANDIIEQQSKESDYSKYSIDVKDLDSIDVAGICKRYEIDDPSGMTQQAVKKLLLGGKRSGGKSIEKDYREAIMSIERTIELTKD